MIFTPADLPGAFVVQPEPIEDERGSFARLFTPGEFEARGLNSRIALASVSFNRVKGTLRGMHYQLAPHAETKLVRCGVGAIYDVIVDLRPDSPAFRRWIGVELSAKNRRMLYIPEGFAHGFLTLGDESEVFYQISADYAPHAARGVRYDDPAFGINWPGAIACISERDRTYPDFTG
jgi:dTDP-4-dehydrorhamnose 3,5-epimerase